MYIDSSLRAKLSVLPALLILLLGTQAYAAGISKWVDENGKTHYGAQAPAGAQATAVKKPPSSTAGGTATAPKVVLYATSWCGYCRQARAYLKSNRIAYTEKDIERDRFAKRDYQRLGGRGVPFLVRGEKDVLRGFNQRSYEQFFAQP